MLCSPASNTHWLLLRLRAAALTAPYRQCAAVTPNSSTNRPDKSFLSDICSRKRSSATDSDMSRERGFIIIEAPFAMHVNSWRRTDESLQCNRETGYSAVVFF
ncbi:hypothetical protein BDP55DRAFT_646412 [Colletotrichum godetiae]|uniref:Secreted protein n=1 Tax=Colletotrichum godetiae TaxID=1209918 RepID=A0AAJ0AVR4_9PEZI|nr:uncharacterized protein BDP55DRAFT_646412 [Colletotrichum godetiae]KAK1691244.1 hypothetical protein BDP55DRAFT_646412 [Colletotrichum godetiae]